MTSAATKHFFPTSDNLVLTSLRGLVSQNPSIRLIPTDKVVFDPQHPKQHVAIIGGGGVLSPLLQLLLS